MFDDNDINLKTEYNKATNELVELRQKYSELEQDWKYIKSLLDAEFEKNIQLQKENEELKHQLSQQEMEYTTTAYRQAEENEELKLEIQQLKNQE